MYIYICMYVCIYGGGWALHSPVYWDDPMDSHGIYSSASSASFSFSRKMLPEMPRKFIFHAEHRVHHGIWVSFINALWNFGTFWDSYLY